MKNTFSSCLRYLGGIVVLLFFYPVVQTFAVTDNKDDVLSGNEQTLGILAVKKINPTTFEVLLFDQQRITIDFYGENIFRIFRDPAGGIIRDPEATPG